MDKRNQELRALFANAFPTIITTDESTMISANTQWRNPVENTNYVALLTPKNESQLTKIFSLCAKHNVGIVPRAGGTALTNGSTIAPQNTYEGRGKPCVLVQPNFESKLDIEYLGNDVFVTVSPDITAKKIEEHAELTGKYKVPVDLGIGSKEGIATIAGYLANNAAGTGAAFHGRAIDMVEHVRAIKADGTKWEMKRGDNQLHELIGMGGTTGFITQTTIKLNKVPKNTAVMALRLNDTSEMYNLLDACKITCWNEMQMFERINDDLFQEVAGQLDRKSSTYTKQLNKDKNNKGDIVFIELGSDDKTVAELKQTLENLTKILKHDTQPIIPRTKDQQKRLLEYRVVNASLACEKYAEQHGGKVVAFDISIPEGDDAPFPSEKLIKQLRKEFKGIQIFSFGHAAGVEKISPITRRGGTALHFNPILPKGLTDQEQRLRGLVFAEVSMRDGKIVSEHAVGTKLVESAKKYTSIEYAEHSTLIQKHDPQNILNPNAFVHDYS